MANSLPRGTPLAALLFRRDALVFVITLICSLIIFILSSGFIFQTMWDQVTQGLRVEIEREADTIARLLVFEFSHLTDLETQPEPDPAVVAHLERLLWQKVTFNETIKGIELIRRHADEQGRHLVFSYFPLSRQGAEADQGPQKLLKSFAGPEGELIRILNREQRVDRRLLEAINQGRKMESEMLLRYFPLYIPLPDQGAIYWGVTKVGINTDVMRRFLVLLEHERISLRRSLAWIMAGSAAFALGLGLWGLRWVGRRTAAPLGDYSRLNAALESGAGVDVASLLDHLNQQESQGIYEIEHFRRFGVHLGEAVQSLAERLIKAEGQAAAGRLAGRLAQAGADQGAVGPGWPEVGGLFTSRPVEWRDVELQPFLDQLSRLLASVLPPGAVWQEARQSLPPLYGCEAYLVQAIFSLVDFALGELPPGGEMQWQVRPGKTGGLEMALSFSGRTYPEEEISRLLQPLKVRTGSAPPLGPGLAAAIAAQHGGRLEIRANPAGGLSLRLEIPDSKKLLASEVRGADTGA